MKRLITALALTVLLFTSALAGEIPSGDAPQPSPPEEYRPTSTASAGQVTTVGRVTLPESDPASLDPMQSLLLTILSLLAR